MGDQPSEQYVEPNQPPEIPSRRRLSSEVEYLPYYNPDVKNMDEVREAMMPYLLQDGYFMLRSSFSKPGIYTVSIMHQRSIKHFNIGRTAHSFFLQEKHFSTITQLIQHYAHQDVPNLEGVRHIRLYYPIRYVPDPLSSVRASFRHSLRMDVPAGMQRNDVPIPRSPVRKTASTAKLKPHDVCETWKPQGINGGKSVVSLPSGICGAGEKYTVKLPPKNMVPCPGRDRCQSDSSYDCQRLPQSQENSNRLSGQHSASTSSVTSSSSFIYDRVRNVDVDRTSELISILRLEESRGAAKCDCGLYEEESELPLGWSVHISHEQQSYGRVFFMSPEGQTAWNLPLQVSLLLSTEQQDQIRRLLNGFRPDVASPQQTEVASRYAKQCGDNSSSGASCCGPTAGMPPRRTPKLLLPETLPHNAKLPHEPVVGNNYGIQHACSDDDVFT